MCKFRNGICVFAAAAIGSAVLVHASAQAAGKAAGLVPESIRKMSVITVPTQADYPPYEFYAEDNKTITGLDIDIMNAIGETLNLKFEYVNAAVATIIPSLQNGRYLISISALFDRPSDQQQVDFVDYFQSGTILLAAKGNPLKINDWGDLCGKRAMGTQGQPSLTLVEEQSKKCTQSGKPAVDVQNAKGTSVRLQALKSGRTDAIPTDSAVGVYLAKKADSAYDVASATVDPHLLGIPFRKEEKAFQKAVQAALVELKSSGRYQQILEKWGVASGGLNDFPINGAKK